LSARDVQSLLAGEDAALVVGSRAFHPSVARSARESVERLVREAHRDEPLGDGLPVTRLASVLPFPPELLEQAVNELTAAGTIERRGAVLTTPGWQPVLTAADAALKQRIWSRIQEAGAEPPEVAALHEEYQRDPVPYLRMLERERAIIPVEPGRFYAVEVVNRLVTKLRAEMTEGREYSPSELRDVLGLSRKYLIPFLEFCDRERITERRTTGRVRLPTIV
jgi:selenocysteine-specific elongation factor